MASKNLDRVVPMRESSQNGLSLMAVESFDAIVLGSGEAGKYIAWNLASSGKKTALIERQYIGGSCPNIACLPTNVKLACRRLPLETMLLQDIDEARHPPSHSAKQIQSRREAP